MSAAPPERLSHGDSLRLLGRAFALVAPERRAIAIKVLLSMVGFLPTILMPWPAKIIIDHAISGIAPEDSPIPYPFFMQPIVSALHGASTEHLLLVMFAFMSATLVLLGAWAVEGRDLTTEVVGGGQDSASTSEQAANMAYTSAGGVAGWVEYRWTLRLSQRLNHLLRSRVFEQLARLPFTTLDNQRIGDSIYRVLYDTPAISEVCYRAIVGPLTIPLQVLLAIWMLVLSYHSVPIVVWLVVGIVPVVLLATFPFSAALRRSAEEARRAGAVTTATIEETTHNILAVQSLGTLDQEQQRFASDSRSSFDSYRRWFLLNATMFGVAGASGLALATIMYNRLTDLVFEGKLTAGDLGVVFSLYVIVGYSAAQLAMTWIELQKNVAGLRRVFEILDLPSDPRPSGARPLPAIERGFAFEQVGFHYPDGMQALRGIDLSVRRGQMIALCGPAGAGKTTLAYMFPRFVVPSTGRITVDDVDLAQVDLDDLRRQVSFVFQEPVLLDASVADNLRLGKPGASDAELRRAAELAGALEFIERWPQGFDTPLGRAGSRASVGQRQRLSIARALVRDAPVLILDEPTAALDPETEQQLVRTLQLVARDKLVIVIAHRLSTIRHADLICFVQGGEIIERGTHAELMQRADGAYRRFVALQGNAPTR